MLPELGLVVALILMILGSVGLPVGLPPTPEDPLLAKVAPAECLAYTSWAGTGKLDPNSTNSTEKLLADPETARIREFAHRVLAALQKDALPEEQAAISKAMAVAQRFASKPGAMFVESISFSADGKPIIKAAVVSRQDAEAATFDAQLKEIVKEGKRPIEQVTVAANGRNYAVTVMKGPAGEFVSWAVVGNYFMIAQGEGTLAAILTRVAAPAPAFIADLARGAPSPRVVSRSYVNIAGVKKALASQLPLESESMLSTLGLDQMQGLYGISALDDQGFVSRNWLTHAAPPTGLFRPVAGEPLTAADLASVPADATLALVMRGDANQALAGFLELQGQLDPQAKMEIEQRLAGTKAILGFDAQKDLLGSLGTVWRIYSSPTDGPMLLPGATLVIDVKDAPKLKGIITKVVQLMKLQEAQGAPPIEVSKIGEVDVFTLGGLPPGVPASPSWAVVKDRFVLAATPITLKNFIRRDTTFESLAKSPAVLKALAGKPTALAYVNMKEVVDTYGPLLPSGVQLAARQLDTPLDFGPLPAVEKLAVHMQPTVVAFTATDRTWEWTSRQTLPGGDLAQSAPIAAALLLPAAKAAQDAARRMQSANNLKQIGLALHNYHSTYNRFPPAYTVDKNGKPLHSWRTLILPYMEQSALFDRIKFDEPWDSAHNLKLLQDVEIGIYRTPGLKLQKGHTNYLGIRSKDSAFGLEGKGRSIDEFRDGTSNSVFVVEAGPAASVLWYKPDDFVPDDKDPTKGLFGAWPTGFNVAIADGSVRFVSSGIDPKVLKALFTVSGGEVIGPDDLDGPRPGAPGPARPGAQRPDFNAPRDPPPAKKPAVAIPVRPVR